MLCLSLFTQAYHVVISYGMICNLDFMSYNPVMKPCKPSSAELYHFINNNSEFHLDFARELLLMKHPPGDWKQTPYHTFSMIVSGGHINTWFADQDETMHTRRIGEVWFLPARRIRRVEVVQEYPDKPIKMLAVAFRFQLMGNIDLLDLFEMPLLLKGKTSDCICSIMRKVSAEITSNSDNVLSQLIERKKACTDMLYLLNQLSRPRADITEMVHSYSSIEPALRILSQNYKENISIQFLAEACFLSRSQFHHVFRQITGLSPIGYQQKQRLNEAKRLLWGTDMGIREIAEASGWNDQFHFSRIFKKMTGMSPQKYRNNDMSRFIT